MIDPSGQSFLGSFGSWISRQWRYFERSSTGQAVLQAAAAITGTVLGSLIGQPELGVVAASAMSAGTNYAFTGNLTSAVEAGAATAITAGAFYEAGDYLQGLQGGGLPADAPYAVPYPVSAATTAAVHAAAGAAAGGINAAITGGNIGLGAVAGGFSGGMGSFAPSGSGLAGQIITGGVTGGTVYALYGKSFGEGFAQGAVTAGFGMLYNDQLHSVFADTGVTNSYGGDLYGGLRENYGPYLVGAGVAVEGAALARVGYYALSVAYLSNPAYWNMRAENFISGFAPGLPAATRFGGYGSIAGWIRARLFGE